MNQQLWDFQAILQNTGHRVRFDINLIRQQPQPRSVSSSSTFTQKSTLYLFHKRDKMVPLQGHISSSIKQHHPMKNCLIKKFVVPNPFALDCLRNFHKIYLTYSSYIQKIPKGYYVCIMENTIACRLQRMSKACSNMVSVVHRQPQQQKYSCKVINMNLFELTLYLFYGYSVGLKDSLRKQHATATDYK